MPGAALHLFYAHRALQRWRLEPSFAASGLHDPRVVEAFLQGAVAPDMGYFCPGTRPISDLTHRSRCADLAREMVQRAATPLQRAFAWGWVTHLLADVAVHPLINRATAELVGAGSSRPLTAAERPASHLRVELGLDAYLQARHPELRHCGFGAALTIPELGFLFEAYRRTHGEAIDAGDVARAYRAMLRLTPLLLALGRVTGVTQGVRRRLGSTTGAGAATTAGAGGEEAGEGRLAVIRSFVTHVSPRPWLVRAVRECTRTFGEGFLAHQLSALRDLENLDLDTGGRALQRA
jgi:Zinc dependent phospholipase C